MRRLALMENTTMTNTTQITRVRFACPQVADRSLNAGVRGGFSVSMFGSANSKAPAVKDVAYLRSRRPPI
jgi:hypothetical protein